MVGGIDADSPTLRVLNQKVRRADNGQVWRDAFFRLFVTAAALVALFTFVFGFYVVPDNGMDPKLEEGDLVLYYRLASDLESGDVAVYDADGKTHIGRIVAMPAETVEIYEDGKFLVNGSPYAVEYGRSVTPAVDGITYPCLNSLSGYFLLGDNYERAYDSRTCGSVDRADIKGKVITVLRRRSF